MARPSAVAAAFVFVLLLTGCGEAAREAAERAAQVELSPRVTTTINVGPEGQVSSLLFAEGSVWVTGWNASSSTVLRIDPRTNEVAARIAVRRGNLEDGPFVAWNGVVWAGAGHELVRIDPRTAQVRGDPLPVGKPIAGTSLLAGEGGLWFVAIGTPATINRFDPATGRLDVDVSLDPPASR